MKAGSIGVNRTTRKILCTEPRALGPAPARDMGVLGGWSKSLSLFPMCIMKRLNRCSPECPNSVRDCSAPFSPGRAQTLVKVTACSFACVLMSTHGGEI